MASDDKQQLIDGEPEKAENPSTSKPASTQRPAPTRKTQLREQQSHAFVQREREIAQKAKAKGSIQNGYFSDDDNRRSPGHKRRRQFSRGDRRGSDGNINAQKSDSAGTDETVVLSSGENTPLKVRRTTPRRASPRRNEPINTISSKNDRENQLRREPIIKGRARPRPALGTRQDTFPVATSSNRVVINIEPPSPSIPSSRASSRNDFSKSLDSGDIDVVSVPADQLDNREALELTQPLQRKDPLEIVQRQDQIELEKQDQEKLDELTKVDKPIDPDTFEYKTNIIKDIEFEKKKKQSGKKEMKPITKPEDDPEEMKKIEEEIERSKQEIEEQKKKAAEMVGGSSGEAKDADKNEPPDKKHSPAATSKPAASPDTIDKLTKIDSAAKNESSTPTKAGTSVVPTVSPTTQPSVTVPTVSPTTQPAVTVPTVSPTTQPAVTVPTVSPTTQPSVTVPTVSPTTQPSVTVPTVSPTTQPSVTVPTVSPTTQPSVTVPTVSPTTQPSVTVPTVSPTTQPSVTVPTVSPTTQPSVTVPSPTVTTSIPVPVTTTTTTVAVIEPTNKPIVIPIIQQSPQKKKGMLGKLLEDEKRAEGSSSSFKDQKAISPVIPRATGMIATALSKPDEVQAAVNEIERVLGKDNPDLLPSKDNRFTPRKPNSPPKPARQGMIGKALQAESKVVAAEDLAQMKLAKEAASMKTEDFTSKHFKASESRLEASQRLLANCKKADWEIVTNMVKFANPGKYDLGMMDEHGFTPLLCCIRENRLELVERLAELNANLMSTTKDGRNSAHVAAQYSREAMLAFLIGLKPELSKAQGPRGQLPLHVLCCRSSKSVIGMLKLLLHTTEDQLIKNPRLIADKNGCLPIHLAVHNENYAVVHELLRTNGPEQTAAQRTDNGDTPMHIACKVNNVDMTRMIVEHGGTANIQNKEGRTPLHYVAQNGSDVLLRIMYTLKADANIADKEDKTPLHLAAECGKTVLCELLIDKFNASVTSRTKDGSTLMHIAAQNGHTSTALVCLKRGVPLHMPNKRGALGLHCAAAMGHVPMVTTLLDKGTSVDIRTKDNYTALHVAVQSGKPEVIEVLLGQGADVHVKGGSNLETPLHIAAGLAGPTATTCAEMLLKSGAEANVKQDDCQTPLHIAAARGNAVMINLIISDGGDPSSMDSMGETPLHVAVKNCHYETAKILLKFVETHGGKTAVKNLVNQKTKEGLTALHHAAEITKKQGHHVGEDAAVMGLLIDAGGDINIQTTTTNETVMHYATRVGNQNVVNAIVNKIGPGSVQISLNKQSKTGWSPLLEACAHGHKQVVEILLKEHARVDVFDTDGRTGLHLAAMNGHMDVCDVLLNSKAFINSKNKNGETPLHLAAMNGHSRVVALLVSQYGASLESVTLENQTPLHYSAKNGQLPVSNVLLALSANANAKDTHGQTPLHHAAENDYPEVVKLFLKMKSSNKGVLTAVDENGFTCAHIAAVKGSMAVVKELMMIDKAMVIEAKTKSTESTALHMAASGGHKNIVKLLLDNGADEKHENTNGMTPLHMSAKSGHIQILDVFEKGLWRRCSRRTGLSPLHVAAYYGQGEYLREMLNTVPATIRTEPAGQMNPLMAKEWSTEYGFTPLHMASQSGHHELVRMLLNFQGVQVDATSTTMNVIPLHLAAQSGHIAVVGMLLSRSTQQLNAKDSKGRTALHLAATHGHYDMVALLIAQGSNFNAMDHNGWTGMHFATKAGHLNVLKLFVQSSADPRAETKESKIPLCFAASFNHIHCLSFLMQQDHDTVALMDDRRFLFDLMVCGKSHNNRPVEEFILRSPAPIDTSVKLSSIYKDMSEKEKERARDLLNACEFCQSMAVELLSITSTEYNTALLLKAHDSRGRPFLDVLIENEQKDVVAHASVQRYLTEIWNGGIQWGFGKFSVFFFMMLFCPPIWLFFSLPLENKISRAPIIKFVCHLVSHVNFTVLLVTVVLGIIQPVYKYQLGTFVPHWTELILLFWLSGVLVAELSTHGGRSGLGMIRLVIIFLGAIAAAMHVIAYGYVWLVMVDDAVDVRTKKLHDFLYLKNQMYAFVLLCSFVQYLDFLQVHHLFGPWAIIIRDLMVDLTRFLAILFLFVAGFTLHVTSIFQPAYREATDDELALIRMANPGETLEMLFFSLFGLVEPDAMPPMHLVPEFSKYVMKIVFGIYMMVTLIVLINLLIAMMSDTYQRIQAQADTEWKFGRAILIRQMNKKSATPAPINMFTKFVTVIRVAWKNKFNMFTLKAQEDLRHEENIDSYSMETTTTWAEGKGGGTGSGAGDEDNNLDIELNDPSTWKIEAVIPWKRIVVLYCKQTGLEDGNEDNAGESVADEPDVTGTESNETKD